MVKKIISGGQTGIDRIALDQALAYNFPCGGWCPKGRRCEGIGNTPGFIPDKYPLQEMSTKGMAARTEQNIYDSDGTIVLYVERNEGSLYTINACYRLKRPVYEVDLTEFTAGDKLDFKLYLDWLQKHEIETLNIAGNRSSKLPKEYFDKATALIKGLLEVLARNLDESNSSSKL